MHLSVTGKCVCFPDMSINIIELIPEDWSSFRAIRLRALEDAPKAFGSTLAREKGYTENEWIQMLEKTSHQAFIARKGTVEPVGLVVAGPYDHCAGLYSMWVDPACRGEGIGKALVQSVIGWAKKKGFAELLLDVTDENGAAIALYHACGFKETGVQGTLPPPRQHVKEHQLGIKLLDL